MLVANKFTLSPGQILVSFEIFNVFGLEVTSIMYVKVEVPRIGQLSSSKLTVKTFKPTSAAVGVQQNWAIGCVVPLFVTVNIPVGISLFHDIVTLSLSGSEPSIVKHNGEFAQTEVSKFEIRLLSELSIPVASGETLVQLIILNCISLFTSPILTPFLNSSTKIHRTATWIWSGVNVNAPVVGFTFIPVLELKGVVPLYPLL